MMKIYFYGAGWCAPCKMMKPIVADLVKKGYDIEYLDIDTITDVRHNITNVPTFIKEVEGKYVSKLQGATPPARFIEWLEEQ